MLLQPSSIEGSQWRILNSSEANRNTSKHVSSGETYMQREDNVQEHSSVSKIISQSRNHNTSETFSRPIQVVVSSKDSGTIPDNTSFPIVMSAGSLEAITSNHVNFKNTCEPQIQFNDDMRDTSKFPDNRRFLPQPI